MYDMNFIPLSRSVIISFSEESQTQICQAITKGLKLVSKQGWGQRLSLFPKAGFPHTSYQKINSNSGVFSGHGQ